MEWISNIIVTVVIPFVVQFAKSIKMPVKLAPYLALVLGIVYAGIMAIMGGEIDGQTIINALLTGLGVGGAGIALYDVKKTITG